MGLIKDSVQSSSLVPGPRGAVSASRFNSAPIVFLKRGPGNEHPQKKNCRQRAVTMGCVKDSARAEKCDKVTQSRVLNITHCTFFCTVLFKSFHLFILKPFESPVCVWIVLYNKLDYSIFFSGKFNRNKRSSVGC